MAISLYILSLYKHTCWCHSTIFFSGKILAYSTVFHLFVGSTMSALKVAVTEKKGTTVKLQEQLQSLEKDTAAKLSEMDQYNKDMQVRIKYIVILIEQKGIS